MTNVKELYEANKPAAAGNGLFLKIEDGQTLRLRFLDIPVVFDSEYEGKMSVRYAWPVYNHEESKVQVFQGGSTIYHALNALIQDDDWGDPAEYDVKVGRSGKGTDTKYTVSPSPKSLDLPKDLDTPNVEAILGKSQFVHSVRKLGQAPKPKDTVIEDLEGEPISLDQIPF